MRALGWTGNTGRGSIRSQPESLLWNQGYLRKSCKRVRMCEGRHKSLRGASAMKKRGNSNLSGETDFWLNSISIGSSTHLEGQWIWLGLKNNSVIENVKVQCISSSLSFYFLPFGNSSFNLFHSCILPFVTLHQSNSPIFNRLNSSFAQSPNPRPIKCFSVLLFKIKSI